MSRKKYMKAHFYGREGAGKTGGAMRLCAALHNALGGNAVVAMFDTGEGIAEHWADDLEDLLGCTVAAEYGDSPADLAKFIKRCEAGAEKTGKDVILVVDSATDVAHAPRNDYSERNPGKEIPYTVVDSKVKPLVRALKTAKLHWIMTMREKDDRVVNDVGKEVVDGKKGKAAADLEFVARIKAHAERKKKKGGGQIISYTWTMDHGREGKTFKTEFDDELPFDESLGHLSEIVEAYAPKKVSNEE